MYRRLYCHQYVLPGSLPVIREICFVAAVRGTPRSLRKELSWTTSDFCLPLAEMRGIQTSQPYDSTGLTTAS